MRRPVARARGRARNVRRIAPECGLDERGLVGNLVAVLVGDGSVQEAVVEVVAPGAGHASGLTALRLQFPGSGLPFSLGAAESSWSRWAGGFRLLVAGRAWPRPDAGVGFSRDPRVVGGQGRGDFLVDLPRLCLWDRRVGGVQLSSITWVGCPECRHYMRQGHTIAGRPRKDRPFPRPPHCTLHLQAVDSGPAVAPGCGT